MASGSEHKNWWDNLDWALAESVQDTIEAGQRALRSLPNTLSAYKLNQPSPVDHIEADPVERMKSAGRTRPVNPKFLAPPPKPACLEKKAAEKTAVAKTTSVEQPALEKKNLEKSQQLRAADIPAAEKPAVEKKNLEKSQQLRAADIPAADKPAAEKKNLEKSQQLREADVPAKVTENKSGESVETKRLCLEDLLNPDYDGYIS
jgi:hypothetical protein